MWEWSLEWDEVTPTILVGSCPMKISDLEQIRNETGIDSLLSLQHDDCHTYWSIDFEGLKGAASKLGLRIKRVPIRDFDIQDMRRQLPCAIAALAELQTTCNRTLVHCTAGFGRAPLTVLGYLTLVEGLDPEQAIQLILRARPKAVPAWEALHGCVEDLVALHRDEIARRAYEIYERGEHATAEEDWRHAQAEVLRDVLCRRGCGA